MGFSITNMMVNIKFFEDLEPAMEYYQEYSDC